jgi:homospermidine synthase
MTTWPVHAIWNGPIVIIGFGSIGRGTLPLLLRHVKCDRHKITVIDPDASSSHLAEKEKIAFIKEAVTKQNYKKLLTPLLSAGPGPAFLINLSVDVDSVDIMALSQKMGALYLDTVIEPWPGFYYNPKIGNAERTNYALRERMLALKRSNGGGPTTISCCGANPGMVSWFVKQALLNIAADLKLVIAEPTGRSQWGKLMQRLGVKGIHIAERDTQRALRPKPLDCFVNTWSVEGFISEGLQPAELGWGTSEKKLPPNAKTFKSGCRAAIYLERPGADTRVRTWVPTAGPQFGYLVTHNESISIADYFTVRDDRKVIYRPTCHYAYHPCNNAVLSLHEMFGAGGRRQSKVDILEEDEILDGMDELGVLVYGHKKNAYWFGSQLTIDETRKLAPNQNATGLQVTSAVLAGMVWAIENPRAGIVETDEMDFRRCLEIQSPYLGALAGYYTDWTPLQDRGKLFDEKLDRRNPWAFSNILVQ